MNWSVVTAPAFLKDLADLPTGVRGRIETFVFETLRSTDKPLGLGKLEKLKGYRDFYKVRFGNYRLGVKLDGKHRRIHVLRVLHRRDIYRHFP